MDTNELIAKQIEYYRARAQEYDGEVIRAIEALPGYLKRFVVEKAELEAWLDADPPTGHVLEIAAGSGNRTSQIVGFADRVTALDASPEMLDLLRGKHPSVETIEADVFCWEPPQKYDNIFFGYWISHVPRARWVAFWELLDRALAPGGRVWFMDNAHPEYADTNGPGDWPVAAGLRVADHVDDEIQTRTLNDGSKWTMVKRFWWPDELVADLAELGWTAEIGHTGFAFIYGVAQRP
ncbi:MAG: methyltransferase domain-containing protein [Acidimicrobiia bacterium]|nr:methyltransferase domain-containing protein [Acidimicrobiia bacterium]